MVLDACRIKRCDNLYSGEETLMRHHWPYAWFSSRMCTCAVYPKTQWFVFLWFSTTYALNIVSLCTQNRIDRDQIEHMLALILAIDVWWSWPLISLNISPPPPSKKVLGKIWLCKYFRGAFNTLWQKTLVNATSMGVSNALHYPNEL